MTREPVNKLSHAERDELLKVANSQRFRELSPKQIVPMLADDGVYLASVSTFYRVLRQAGQMTHRGRTRAPMPRPAQLVATGPNQVWSWDITYLHDRVRGKYFYLYMILDVWSRKIVGWEVHERECAQLSGKLLERVCRGMELGNQPLVLHSDNGGPMRGSTMKATMERLGVTASYSRPRVSNDNPFSEAAFKTLKYRPWFKEYFENIEDARQWVCEFVQWYNWEHLHSSLEYVTPGARHDGKDQEQLERRRQVWREASERHPTRFGGKLKAWQSQRVVVLNRHRSLKTPVTSQQPPQEQLAS